MEHNPSTAAMRQTSTHRTHISAKYVLADENFITVLQRSAAVCSFKYLTSNSREYRIQSGSVDANVPRILFCVAKSLVAENCDVQDMDECTLDVEYQNLDYMA